MGDAKQDVACGDKPGHDEWRTMPDLLGVLETSLYVDAFERFDIESLVSLLHEDATMSMPPYELWLRGADELRKWLLGAGSGCRGSRFVPVAANGCRSLFVPSGGGRKLGSFRTAPARS